MNQSKIFTILLFGLAGALVAQDRMPPIPVDKQTAARSYVYKRWPNGVICPTCGNTEVHFLANQKRWECKGNHPKWQFSAKVGSIFEDSPIPLEKWLCAVWMITNCKNGISRASFIGRLALLRKPRGSWFIVFAWGCRLNTLASQPAKWKSMSPSLAGKRAICTLMLKHERSRDGAGRKGKAIVAAVLERGGKVRATVVDNGKVRATVVDKRKKKQLQAIVREHVEPKSALYSDALKSYDGLDGEFVHQVVDHAVEYVNDNVHTNGLENFWSLLKRGINGTYVSVEPYHLFRYVDEQSFRYNNRKDMNDGERFSAVLSQLAGKRLTWNELTGVGKQTEAIR